MSEKELIKKFKKLPEEAQQEAADFVEFLSNKYFKSAKNSSEPKKSILNSSFRGIWKDREDMKDSTKWVRNIRKSRQAKYNCLLMDQQVLVDTDILIDFGRDKSDAFQTITVLEEGYQTS